MTIVIHLYFLFILSIISTVCHSVVDTNVDSEMANPKEGISQLGHEKSEESYKAWEKYWRNVETGNSDTGIVSSIQGRYVLFRSIF